MKVEAVISDQLLLSNENNALNFILFFITTKSIDTVTYIIKNRLFYELCIVSINQVFTITSYFKIL